MQKIVDGILVNYEIVGKTNHPLLILPGWQSNFAEWMPFAKLLGNRYKVILLDLPGFGGSNTPPGAWGTNEYQIFVEHFLETLKVKKTKVLGHSFGGRVAILLAARTNVVEQLILVDAAGMELKSPAVRLKKVIWNILKPTKFFIPPAIFNQLRRIIGSRDYLSAGNLKGTLVKVVNQDLRDELQKIKSTTLIIWGEKDKELPLAEGLMLKAGIKNSVLRIIWGAGHYPQTEKPEEFVQILTEEGI